MAYYVLKESELGELNELSASSLGVVQKDSGTAMNPNSRTLVIGLGGMGLSTVYNLKKTLEERIGKIPDSSTDIKFLSIDTSKADLNQRVESGVLSDKEVEEENESAIRVYKKSGFSPLPYIEMKK